MKNILLMGLLLCSTDMLAFDKFKKPDRKSITKGQILFEGNGCVSCHTTDGSENMGPTLKRMRYKSDAYIRDSIREPNKVIARRFKPDIMPIIPLTDQEITEIIKYLKNLPF